MVLQATSGGQGLDPTSMCETLFKDKHFINMLGDLLNRRPGAKKVEIFMAKELRQRINEMQTEQKIKSKCHLVDKVQIPLSGCKSG